MKISGKVIHGDKIGRELGFPTANISFESKTLPSSVFQVVVEIENEIYHGMGVHAPWKKTFEVHIFNFQKDIYSTNISIYLIKKIRDNQNFENLKDLAIQLQKDKDYIKSLPIKVLTFGTFDIFHKGHEYYLESAKKYGTHLATIVARDKTVQKIKGFIPKENENTRVQNIRNSSIPDEVVLGDLEDPLIPVKSITPDIICLGYDQSSFPHHLKTYTESLKIPVIRIKSFEPETYKSSKLKK